MSRRGENLENEEKNTLPYKIHGFIDSNIQLVQYSLYSVGVVGVLLVCRSIRMTTVFNHVEDIPARFIRHHVYLLGRVEAVTEEGILEISHMPIVRLPFIKQRNHARLPVYLASVNVTPSGTRWLLKNVDGKVVWFRLLQRDLTPPRLHCIVSLPKRFRPIPVNENLVRMGLSKVASYGTALTPLPENAVYQNLLDRLIRLEMNAAKKGTGMWHEEKPAPVKHAVKSSFDFVKKVLASPVKFVAWISKKLRRREQ